MEISHPHGSHPTAIYNSHLDSRFPSVLLIKLKLTLSSCLPHHEKQDGQDQLSLSTSAAHLACVVCAHLGPSEPLAF